MVKRIAAILLARAVPASGLILITLMAPVAFDVEKAADFLVGITLLYLLGISSRFGLDIFVLKVSAERFDEEEKIYTSAEVAFFLISLSLSLVALIFYFSICSFFGFTAIYSWALYALPAFSCQALLASFLKATGDEFWGAIAEPGMSSLIAVVFFVVFPRALIVDLSFSYLYAVWFVLIITLSYIVLTRSFFWGKGDFKSGFRESFCFLLNQISSYASQWYPLFLLGMMDKTLVVYYAIANRLASVISFVGVTIDSYAAPRFSNSWKSGNMVELYSLKARVEYFSRIGALACFIFIGFGAGIYGVAQSFNAQYYYMSFFLIASYAAAISLGANSFFLMMTNNSHYVTRISLLIFVAVVILSSVLFWVEAPMLITAIVGFAIFTRSFVFYRKAMRSNNK